MEGDTTDVSNVSCSSKQIQKFEKRLPDEKHWAEAWQELQGSWRHDVTSQPSGFPLSHLSSRCKRKACANLGKECNMEDLGKRLVKFKMSLVYEVVTLYGTCCGNVKAILVHFYVVSWTVCKGSANNAIWKLRSLFHCFMEHEFKSAEFHATCYGDKILFRQRNFSAKTDMSWEKNCPCNMFPSECRPMESSNALPTINHI